MCSLRFFLKNVDYPTNFVIKYINNLVNGQEFLSCIYKDKHNETEPTETNVTDYDGIDNNK